MDLAARFLVFQHAEREAARAVRLLEEAPRAAPPGAPDPAELPRRRVELAVERLDRATRAFTGGRPLYEAVWALPDHL